MAAVLRSPAPECGTIAFSGNPMSALRTVVVIRHALSRANQDPTEYARTSDHDIPLVSPLDDAAGLGAGDLLRSLGLPASELVSWSSPHLRCRQTEQLVLERAFGSQPGGAAAITRRESFLLRERDYGHWNGLSDAEVRARYPELHTQWVSAGDPMGRFLFRYPGGESRADVAVRVATFQERLRRDRCPHHVLFVHGIVFRLLRMVWFDRSPAWVDGEPHPENAAMVRFSLAEDGQEWVESVPVRMISGG